MLYYQKVNPSNFPIIIIDDLIIVRIDCIKPQYISLYNYMKTMPSSQYIWYFYVYFPIHPNTSSQLYELYILFPVKPYFPAIKNLHFPTQTQRNAGAVATRAKEWNFPRRQRVGQAPLFSGSWWNRRFFGAQRIGRSPLRCGSLLVIITIIIIVIIITIIII